MINLLKGHKECVPESVENNHVSCYAQMGRIAGALKHPRLS